MNNLSATDLSLGEMGRFKAPKIKAKRTVAHPQALPPKFVVAPSFEAPPLSGFGEERSPITAGIIGGAVVGLAVQAIRKKRGKELLTGAGLGALAMLAFRAVAAR